MRATMSAIVVVGLLAPSSGCAGLHETNRSTTADCTLQLRIDADVYTQHGPIRPHPERQVARICGRLGLQRCRPGRTWRVFPRGPAADPGLVGARIRVLRGCGDERP